jgi:hypothetical protein
VSKTANQLFVCVAGLPDGIFSYQKSLFGYILELKMLVKYMAMFNIYDRLVHFMATWTLGAFGHLVRLFPFWYVAPRQIWQPLVRTL